MFAVGDVRSGSTKMVAPATGDGGMADHFAGAHLAQATIHTVKRSPPNAAS